MPFANALAFTGSSYLFSSLSKDRIDKERKRHNLAVEKLQKTKVKWQEERQERIDFINKKLMLEKKAENKFTELSDAMRKYYEVFGKQIKPMYREPQPSDFYTPSDDQHERELAFIAITMIGIGAFVYYKV